MEDNCDEIVSLLSTETFLFECFRAFGYLSLKVSSSDSSEIIVIQSEILILGDLGALIENKSPSKGNKTILFDLLNWKICLVVEAFFTRVLVLAVILAL